MRKSHEELMKSTYITCKCGYNNSKEKLNLYGKCLRCGEILDKRIYLKVMMRGRIIKKDGKEVYM